MRYLTTTIYKPTFGVTVPETNPFQYIDRTTWEGLTDPTVQGMFVNWTNSGAISPIPSPEDEIKSIDGGRISISLVWLDRSAAEQWVSHVQANRAEHVESSVITDLPS